MTEFYDDVLAESRFLPPLTDLNRAYWTGGKEGQLLLMRCQSCRTWVNPPESTTCACGGTLAPEPSCGTGTVYTFVVNHQPYNPVVPNPYVVALVEMDDQANLRVFTNLLGIEPQQVRVGMPVEVRFEDHGEVAVPIFVPRP
jgi:uncharacterized protein